MGGNENINISPEKPPEGPLDRRREEPQIPEAPESAEIIAVESGDFELIDNQLADVGNKAEQDVKKETELIAPAVESEPDLATEVKGSQAEALATIEREKAQSSIAIAKILNIPPEEVKAKIDNFDSRLREIDVREEELEKGGLKTFSTEKERAELAAERAEIEKKKTELQHAFADDLSILELNSQIKQLEQQLREVEAGIAKAATPEERTMLEKQGDDLDNKRLALKTKRDDLMQKKALEQPQVEARKEEAVKPTPEEVKAKIDNFDSRLREIDVRQEELEKGGLKTFSIEKERAELAAERAEIEKKKTELQHAFADDLSILELNSQIKQLEQQLREVEAGIAKAATPEERTMLEKQGDDLDNKRLALKTKRDDLMKKKAPEQPQVEVVAEVPAEVAPEAAPVEAAVVEAPAEAAEPAVEAAPQEAEPEAEAAAEAGPEVPKVPENDEDYGKLKDRLNALKTALQGFDKIPAADLSEADKAQKETLYREKDLVFSMIGHYEEQKDIKGAETEIKSVDVKIEAIKKKYPDGNLEAASEEDKAEMESLLEQRQKLANKVEDGNRRLFDIVVVLAGLQAAYNKALTYYRKKEAEAEQAEAEQAEKTAAEAAAEAPSAPAVAAKEKKAPPKEVGKKVKSALGKGLMAAALVPILGVISVSKGLNIVSKIAGWIDQRLENFFSRDWVEKGKFWWNKLTLANYYKRKRAEAEAKKKKQAPKS